MSSPRFFDWVLECRFPAEISRDSFLRDFALALGYTAAHITGWGRKEVLSGALDPAFLFPQLQGQAKLKSIQLGFGHTKPLGVEFSDT